MIARDLTRRALLGAAAATLLLGACSGDADESAESTESAAPSNATLAGVLAGADDFSAVAATLSESGLADVFDGAAAYTLLVPRDEVFDALGETGDNLRSAEQRPAMVALLRDHIVPGYLTPEDIARAIELDDDGQVAMTTMAGHTLTFASDGGTIAATGVDGATARFDGDALQAVNGVAIPVDGLVVELGEPTPQ
jgi:uncharacterized surface protein with fasciclin (FAS1) repeats